MNERMEPEVHYNAVYDYTVVMKTLYLIYELMTGPVRDQVAAINGIAINQTRKNVYMDQIYRVAEWGTSSRTLHDKAKAMYEAHIESKRGRHARDESQGSRGWWQGGGSYQREQSGGARGWARTRERTRSALPTRVELTERPSVRLTLVDEPGRPRSPRRRSHDIRGDSVPSFTITPTGDGGSTTSWAGTRRWSRGAQLRTAIGANQSAPAPRTPERRRSSRAPRQPSDSRSRSPHERQAAAQQPGSASSAAWGSTYGGYTEEEWAEWRNNQWWGHRGWWNWWNW